VNFRSNHLLRPICDSAAAGQQLLHALLNEGVELAACSDFVAELL
jgi:hypothetical protein